MAPPLPGQVVGQAIKGLRAAKGWSQEAATQRLQQFGLQWQRYQLGDLESGRRQDLNLTELLLLAEVFGVPPAELLRGVGSTQLSATERPLRVVRRLLRGEIPLNSDLLGPAPIPDRDPELLGDPPYWQRIGDRIAYVYSATTAEAARRLGVDVDEVWNVARELWGTPVIDVERNRIIREHGGDADQVTRDLIEKLRERIEETRRETEA